MFTKTRALELESVIFRLNIIFILIETYSFCISKVKNVQFSIGPTVFDMAKKKKIDRDPLSIQLKVQLYLTNSYIYSNVLQYV